MFVYSPSQLKTEFLPLLSVIFVSENSVVAAVSIKHKSHISTRMPCFKLLNPFSGP